MLCRTFSREPRFSQFKFVCNLGRNVLEGDRGPGYSLEAHPIEGQTGQFTHLHFPLYETVLPGVTVHAEQQESFLLLVIAVVGIQDLANLFHHVIGVHGTSGLHAPGKAQRTGLGIF